MDCNGDDADICESSCQRRSSARVQKLQREKAVRTSSKKEEPVTKTKEKLKNVKASKRQKVDKSLIVGSEVIENGVTKLETKTKVVKKVEKPLAVGSEVIENGVMKLEADAEVEKVEKPLIGGSEVVGNGVMKFETEAEVVAQQGENTRNVDKMVGVVENGMTPEDKSAYSMITETLRTFNKYFLQFIQGEEKGHEKTEAVQKEKSPRSKKGDALGSNTKQVARRPDLKALAKMKETNAILRPNNIGSIPGIDVGHQFFSRAEMVAVGFNSHWLNGIDCINHGCEGYSGYNLPIAIAIFMSGQYEDDLDNCDDVIYTGQGGNKLCGNRHQFRDQVMRLGNLGLKNSMEQCVPVRVVRAHESKSSHVGKVYTYDGLYKVVNYWAEKGVSGYIVYKFRLKRLEGQPSLTTNQVQFVRGQIPKSLSELRGLVCKDISDGQENIPIPATNLVDDPPFAPSGFTYCNSVQVSGRVKLPVKASGCNCSGNCAYSKACSCARLNGSDFPYVHRDGGRLVEPKAVVYECGPNCGCGPGCVNRISQRGLKFRLEVFRTPKKGWAVRSWDYIPSGAPVCEYIGKLMKTDDVDAIPENNYIFDIDCLQTMRGLDGREKRLRDVCIPSSETDDDKDSVPEFCLDAGHTGNVARFINHSCQPNLFVQCVLSTHHDIKQARVVLFAADNIPPLKELSYDYGYALNSVEGPDGKIKQLHCFCGATICRKRLF